MGHLIIALPHPYARLKVAGCPQRGWRGRITLLWEPILAQPVILVDIIATRWGFLMVRIGRAMQGRGFRAGLPIMATGPSTSAPAAVACTASTWSATAARSSRPAFSEGAFLPLFRSPAHVHWGNTLKLEKNGEQSRCGALYVLCLKPCLCLGAAFRGRAPKAA